MEVRQLKVKGCIKDAKTGLPLQGVKISTTNNLQGKFSTNKGKFTIAVELESTIPTIKFTHPNYKPVSKKVSPASPQLDITMIKNKVKEELDDNTLIQKALNGSQFAFSKLMKRYKDSVYYVILKMVSSPDDAEDLTIEAFGKAFNKLEKFSPEYAFSTWLFRIAINNAIDFMRKKRLQTLSIDQPISTESGESINPDITDTSLDPEENYIREQRRMLMREITEKLSPKYRTLIELRFFSELSYIEIAEKMDLPIGTVKAQLFRAKQLLHNVLKNSNSF